MNDADERAQRRSERQPFEGLDLRVAVMVLFLIAGLAVGARQMYASMVAQPWRLLLAFGLALMSVMFAGASVVYLVKWVNAWREHDRSLQQNDDGYHH